MSQPDEGFLVEEDEFEDEEPDFDDLEAPSDRPPIWAPSSRPVRRSAIILTVISTAPGKYPARLVDFTVAVTYSYPVAAASRSSRPVRPTSRSHTLVTAVPTTPGNLAYP